MVPCSPGRSRSPRIMAHPSNLQAKREAELFGAHQAIPPWCAVLLFTHALLVGQADSSKRMDTRMDTRWTLFARNRVTLNLSLQVGACPTPKICRPTGTRTRNPRIKSPLLCQLSYRPAQIIVVRGAPPSNRSECETRRPRRVSSLSPLKLRPNRTCAHAPPCR